MLASTGQAVAAILAGIGAIIAAVAGILLIIHETRRKERRAAKAEIDQLGIMLADIRHEALDCQRKLYRLRQRLIVFGVDDEPD